MRRMVELAAPEGDGINRVRYAWMSPRPLSTQYSVLSTQTSWVIDLTSPTEALLLALAPKTGVTRGEAFIDPTAR